jgi:hypothetical protein
MISGLAATIRPHRQEGESPFQVNSNWLPELIDIFKPLMCDAALQENLGT